MPERAHRSRTTRSALCTHYKSQYHNTQATCPGYQISSSSTYSVSLVDSAQAGPMVILPSGTEHSTSDRSCGIIHHDYGICTPNNSGNNHPTRHIPPIRARPTPAKSSHRANDTACSQSQGAMAGGTLYATPHTTRQEQWRVRHYRAQHVLGLSAS